MVGGHGLPKHIPLGNDGVQDNVVADRKGRGWEDHGIGALATWDEVLEHKVFHDHGVSVNGNVGGGTKVGEDGLQEVIVVHGEEDIDIGLVVEDLSRAKGGSLAIMDGTGPRCSTLTVRIYMTGSCLEGGLSVCCGFDQFFFTAGQSNTKE